MTERERLMREIIFRGKSKESGEWIYGVPCYFEARRYHDDSQCHIVKSLYDADGGYIVGANNEEVISETVGQYTGLTDKNGTKIFEGDIIKVSIYYDVGCYPHSESKIVTVEIPSFYNLNIDGDIEVIGNIHDNPELLKEGE